jgi:hypothetical protein
VVRQERKVLPLGEGVAARWCAALSLCVALWWSWPCWGETVLLRRRSLELSEGLELTFYTEQRHGFQDVFTSQVQVERVTRGEGGALGAVRFGWRMFGARKHAGYDERGVVTTTGLSSGRSFNAWWSQGEEQVTSDTQLWLSQAACQELMAQGHTTYAMDRRIRGDGALRLERVRESRYVVRLGGEEVELAALELRSEREDRVVMLADCANPLVLEIDLPGLYLVRLEEARSRRGVVR